MALKEIVSSSIECNNFLATCWLAGQRKYANTHCVPLLDRHEINSVDIIDCCKRIHEIIYGNQVKRLAICNGHDDHNNRFVAFKDIARLTFGVNYIHGQQVSTLLDDTKLLLDQIKGTNFEFDVVPMQIYVNRKRKRVVSKTTVRVSKRPRIMSPQLLDEQHVDYFRNMLTESQLWSKEDEILNIKESQTICTSERFISITQEVILTEIDQNLMWNDGFGETNQTEQAALEDFLPFKNSLKRKSPDLTSTGNECWKTPKLSTDDSSAPCNAIESVCKIDLLHLPEEIESIAVPHPVPLPPPSPLVITVQSKKLKDQRRRKSKLKIDKCIKYSRETLNKNHQLYINELGNNLNVNPRKVMQNEATLNSFKQSHLFPDRLKSHAKLTKEQMEVDCEYTIRAIFNANYSDALASNILKNIEVIPQQINYIEELAEPVIPTANYPENHALELQPCSNNNNNNEVEDFQSYMNKHFDSYNIMMDLLNIWRKDPNRKSIDANQFIKSFPNRFAAAVAFSHLLSLSRDGFIQLFTKLKSLEIDTITLGPESVKLIENIFEFKQI
ncbi:hypothetical protein ACLKA6_000344 [Drosophila palustris]